MLSLIVLLTLVLAVYLFLRLPSFGAAPTGRRLERIHQSPNYREGQFQNLSRTPALTEGTSYAAIFRTFFFTRHPDAHPPAPLPSGKVDLLHLSSDEQVIVWFGHSSYFLQVDGRRFLVDPVFSGHASPVNFTTRAFAGTDRYSVDDLPPIDCLIITHDHWDHLDHQTVVRLKDKVGLVFTGLGTGAHLERWGYEPTKIVEKDWKEALELGDGFSLHATPGRHFSGRSFKRNGTLWLSVVLITPHWRLFLGGDSGYDEHFKSIGEQFGPFDLVLLEDGQYDPHWKYIHMTPEEVVQAAEDLKAHRLMPVHWAKFKLANHDWNDPAIRVFRAAQEKGMPLLMPLIGEKTNLSQVPEPPFRWWEQVKNIDTGI